MDKNSIGGAITTLIGASVTYTDIDIFVRIVAGFLAIVAAVYTIVYTHIKIRDHKRSRDHLNKTKNHDRLH